MSEIHELRLVKKAAVSAVNAFYNDRSDASADMINAMAVLHELVADSADNFSDDLSAKSPTSEPKSALDLKTLFSDLASADRIANEVEDNHANRAILKITDAIRSFAIQLKGT